eukprot:g45918.t1
MDSTRLEVTRRRVMSSHAPVYESYQFIGSRSANTTVAFFQFTFPELLLGLVSLLLYTVARNSFGSTAIPKEVALANAETVLAFEAILHIDFELALQGVFLQYPTIVYLFNGFYTVCHVLIPLSVLFHLCVRAALNKANRAHFFYYRSIWILTSWLSLLGLAFFPVMPPRLINECEDAFGACLGDRYPFVDTHRHFAHIWWGWQDPSHKRIYNHYGSCPSLQAAWALWATCAIWPFLERKRVRTLWSCYYPLTFLATIVTGNHYILDEVAGVVLFVACLIVESVAGVVLFVACLIVGNWVHEYGLPRARILLAPLFHCWTIRSTICCSLLGILCVLSLLLRIPDMHESAEVRKHVRDLEKAEVQWRASHSIERLIRLGLSNDSSSTAPDTLDVVYLWANSSHLCRNLSDEMRALTAVGPVHRVSYVGGGRHYGCAQSRWADHSELLYSLRSLDKYAGHLVQRVFIVTQNGLLPNWLKKESEKLIGIHQDSLLVDYPDAKPALDSQALEWNLDRIPGLSERFLYLNDDIFINQPISYSDFWIGNITVARFDSISTATYAWMHMFHPWFGIMHTGQTLLDRKFGWVGSLTLRPTAAHVVWGLEKSEIARLRKMYAPAVNWTVTSHIRDERDVQLQFMYYHTLIEEDKAVHAPKNEQNELVHSFSPESIFSGHYQGTLEKILQGQLTPKFFCLQDPAESGSHSLMSPEVMDYMIKWLARRFDEPSRWEKPRRRHGGKGHKEAVGLLDEDTQTQDWHKTGKLHEEADQGQLDREQTRGGKMHKVHKDAAHLINQGDQTQDIPNQPHLRQKLGHKVGMAGKDPAERLAQQAAGDTG